VELTASHPDRITPATTNAVFIIDALTALGRNGQTAAGTTSPAPWSA